jgi:stress-induced morphogen
MNAWESLRTDETRSVEELLRQHFPGYPPDYAPAAYRYNLASIRVRVVDPAFRGKSRVEREDMVYPILEQLPDATQDDITILLLFTPEQADNALMNMEFEHPTPSRLPFQEPEPAL